MEKRTKMERVEKRTIEKRKMAKRAMEKATAKWMGSTMGKTTEKGTTGRDQS